MNNNFKITATCMFLGALVLGLWGHDKYKAQQGYEERKAKLELLDNVLLNEPARFTFQLYDKEGNVTFTAWRITRSECYEKMQSAHRSYLMSPQHYRASDKSKRMKCFWD